MAAEPRRLRGRGVALLGAATLLLSACASGTDTGTGFHGSRLPTPWPAPDVTLQATDGSSYDLAQDADAPLTLVFFGYTNCPDICSQELADITSALHRLDDAQRERVDVVFVTTDPERDDRAALTRYLGAFDASYVGLTGAEKATRAVADGFYIHAGRMDPTGEGEQGSPDTEALEEAGDGYLVAHDDHTFAVTRQGDERAISALWMKETTSKQLAEDIVALLEEAP